MGRNSSIEWTHHTFNPWWGCSKVSPACAHCYAESWARRIGLQLWGDTTPRRFFSDTHWKEPLRWNRAAKRDGQRKRVFCASMADVFEAREDLTPWRKRLWSLIEDTPWLDWLLLTKRPEHATRMVPWGRRWPANVWLGTTIENQVYAEERIPTLLHVPALTHFLSCEPLLGPLELSKWLGRSARNEKRIDWVITGGESGPRARPMDPGWAMALRDQCLSAGVAFLFKQWGEWAPAEGKTTAKSNQTLRQTPLKRFGKKAAGRVLDGRTWDGLPPRPPQFAGSPNS